MTKWEYKVCIITLADLKARKGGERVEREGRETENSGEKEEMVGGFDGEGEGKE